jgi:hypothetical protein
LSEISGHFAFELALKDVVTPIPLAGSAGSLDTVQLDRTSVAEFLHLEAQLRKFSLQLDQMQRIALPPDSTRDLIHSIAQQL